MHILAVMSDCELLDQREDVEVVGKKILFLLRVAGGWGGGCGGEGFVAIEEVELGADLKFGNEMGFLEIGSQVAVL